MIFGRLKKSSSTPESAAALDAPSLLLYEASRRFGSAEGVKDALQAALAALQHRFKLAGALLFASAGENPLELTSFVGISEEFSKSLSMIPNEGLLGVVLRSGRARLVAAAESEVADFFIRQMIQRHSIQSAFLTPLTVEGAAIGVAAFLSRSGAAFDPPAIAALTRFADHAALIVRNGRLWDALRSSRARLETSLSAAAQDADRMNQRLAHQAEELKTVYELALGTAASGRVEDVLLALMDGIKELVNVQGGAFFRLQPTSRTLEVVGSAFDRPAAESASLGGRLDESPWLRRVVQDRQAQVLNTVDGSEALLPAWKPIPIRSLVAVPVEQDRVVKGIFCFINKIDGLFTPEDVRLLSLLTGRLADVLSRVELDRELRQRVRDLSLLQDISAELPSVPVLTDTVAAIGRVVRRMLSSIDCCLFFVHHAATEALVMMGGDWNEALTFDLRAFTVGTSEKVPVADVFRESRPAYFEKGASTETDADALMDAFGLQQLLYLPLSVEQERIGILALGTSVAQGLTPDHRRLAELIASHVAIVVERSRLYEKLRSANEKLEQINTLKNEFISMVSHELRTPLTTIKGFVSIVLNEETGPLNDQQRHFLQTSDRAIDRLTLLVSDLLDISRIEAGQIKMQLRPTSVREAVARVAASFAPQIKTQGLTLTTAIPDPLPPVLADADRVAQVLDNLLTNALKFTSKGGIAISAVDKGDFVMISVKDTGSGIPREEHERIFEKFYQIKSGHSWPSKGTGLGLAIVRSIVESHRGKVWVESEPGQGADFHILLPRARPEAMASPS